MLCETKMNPAADPASPSDQTRDGTPSSKRLGNPTASEKGRYAADFSLEFRLMQQLIDRIEELERAVRRWRTTALVLAVVLFSFLTSGVTFFAIQHANALRAADEARMEAIRARDLARLEEVRLEAARQAEQKKE
jgi:hypothetical protein